VNTYVESYNEGWWDQTKAKVAGVGAGIRGDAGGQASAQAQSLLKSTDVFGVFDQFQQDLLKLTKLSSIEEFYKTFPDQAQFIQNIAANLEVLKAGDVGAAAAPATATAAPATGAAPDPAAPAAPAAPVTASVNPRLQHGNFVDQINEAYETVQEAGNLGARWAGAKAKLGNVGQVAKGFIPGQQQGELQDVAQVTVDKRIQSFKQQFMTSVGELQKNLQGVGLPPDGPIIQALNNATGSAEKIEPPAEIPSVPQTDPAAGAASADPAAAPADPAAPTATPAAPTATTAAPAPPPTPAPATAPAPADTTPPAPAKPAPAPADTTPPAPAKPAPAPAADVQGELPLKTPPKSDPRQTELPLDAPDPKSDEYLKKKGLVKEPKGKRELSQTPGNIARRAKTAAAGAAKTKKRGQMDQKNSRARDKRAGRAMDPANIKRREKRRGTWRGESFIRGTEGFNLLVSRYL
jgi:hypothetical protein